MYPHEGAWKAEGTVQESYKLNQKAYAVTGKLQTSGTSFVTVDKSNVVIETVKPAEAEDGIIVRLYECENSLTKATLIFGNVEIEEVVECNLMEEEEQTISQTENQVTVTVKPYEIKTYKVRLKK